MWGRDGCIRLHPCVEETTGEVGTAALRSPGVHVARCCQIFQFLNKSKNIHIAIVKASQYLNVGNYLKNVESTL